MTLAEGTLVVLVRAPLDVARADALTELVRSIAGAPEPPPVACHVSGTPDLDTIETLARLHLLARRSGVRLTVRGGDDLLGLLTLAGLAGVLTADPGCSKGQRNAEPGEQRGVQEVVDVGDPPT